MSPDDIIQTNLFLANQVRELTGMKQALEKQLAANHQTIESLKQQLFEAKRDSVQEA